MKNKGEDKKVQEDAYKGVNEKRVNKDELLKSIKKKNDDRQNEVRK